jgi:magnesium transporter
MRPVVAMLLNFDPLRAIVLRDRVIVIVPDGADSILVELEKRVLGSSDTGSDGMSNIMANSESNTSLDDMGNASSYSADNFAVNIDTTLDKIKEEAMSGKDANDILVSDSNSETGATEIMSDGRYDIPNESSAFSIDLDEDAYINAFADNEWEELEAKDWIDLPFELQSVDAVLLCASAILADDVLDLQIAANSVISELLLPGADVGDRAQEVLRTMKNSIKEMTSRVDGFCRALDCLLEDYEDMALMNLSRLLTHPDRFVQPVSQAVLDEESDEPELIVEAHLQRGHTLKNGLTLVQGQINTTEDFAIRKSDTIRNRLLYINMVISILSLSVTIGSFIGSLFGMNVINSYEDSRTAFRVITFSTIGGSLLFVALTLFTVRRLGALPNLF